MELNKNIKKIRKEKGMKQEQLAEALGVSTAAVSKWETGLSAPELTVLADMADLFEVSIDALMGHHISVNRIDALLADMKALEDDGKYEEAKDVAEKLLRCYPNSETVVEEAAGLYYRIYTCVGEQKAIERSIELTNRLFAFHSDSSEAKHFELLSSLGNQYAMKGDLEMSRKYYTEGNVGKMNDRALAGLLAREGKDKETIHALSDVYVESLFYMMTDVLQMSQSWSNLGEHQKAKDALLWGCAVLDMLKGEAVEHLVSLKITIYIMLALAEEERGESTMANEFVRKAIAEAKGQITDVEKYEFLTVSKSQQLIGTMPTSAEAVVGMLQAVGAVRLAEIALEK